MQTSRPARYTFVREAAQAVGVALAIASLGICWLAVDAVETLIQRSNVFQVEEIQVGRADEISVARGRLQRPAREPDAPHTWEGVWGRCELDGWRS